MARLVVGDYFAFLLAYDAALALGTGHDAVDSLFELRHAELFLVAARREKRRFVDEVREVRSDESGRPARNNVDVHIVLYLLVAEVDLQNVAASVHVGAVDDDLAVEASGTQKRRV